MIFNIEIMKALIELVKQGGFYSICGLIIYLGLNILKTGLILWVVTILYRQTLLTINNLLCFKLVSKKEQISLLSQDTSNKLTTAITEYQENMTKAMKYFLEEANALLMQYKNCNKENKETVNENK